MTTLYYLTALFFIWSELSWLISPIEKTKSAKNFLELAKSIKGKKWDEFPKDVKSELKSKIWKVWILIWLFIGLFTFQWIAFLVMIIFNLFIILPISRLVKFSIAYTILGWINALIGFAFGIFVIVNHYHLKIDLTQWFVSLIK